MKKLFTVLVGISLFCSAGFTCHPGALLLQDYQRDLLFSVGALACSLLMNQGGNTTGDQNQQDIPNDEPAGQEIPGPEGPAGPQGDPGPQGPAGPAGADGQDGTDGQDGQDGAQGPAGPQGPAGLDGVDGVDGIDGANGAPGPFDLFVEDFFAIARSPNDTWDIPVPGSVNYVKISEPALGQPDITTGATRILAFRFPVPNNYTPGNPVTLRLSLYRNVGAPDGCLQFYVVARRLKPGSDVEDYGTQLYVRPTLTPDMIPEGGRVFWVIDLPVNTDGLNYPNDLVPGQMLAFELGTATHDNAMWTVLGAEVFESTSPGELAGATISNGLESCASAE